MIGRTVGTLVHGGVAMTVDSSLKDADHKMEQAVAHLREELSSASGRVAQHAPCSTG